MVKLLHIYHILFIFFPGVGKYVLVRPGGRYEIKEVITYDAKKIYDEKDSQIIIPDIQTINVSKEINYTEQKEREVRLKLLPPVRLKSNNDFVSRLEFKLLIKFDAKGELAELFSLQWGGS